MIAGIAGLCLALLAGFSQAQDKLEPAIWIDPDGCEHWVIDDGAEGFMSPNLQPDGRPVCREKSVCGIVETDILFAFNSFRISGAGRDTLERVFKSTSARAFIVTGHTDNIGSDETNMVLSQRRADAVARVGKSIGAPIIDAVGHGERWPRASNETIQGRRDNRRVEILCLR